MHRLPKNLIGARVIRKNDGTALVIRRDHGTWTYGQILGVGFENDPHHWAEYASDLIYNGTSLDLLIKQEQIKKGLDLLIKDQSDAANKIFNELRPEWQNTIEYGKYCSLAIAIRNILLNYPKVSLKNLNKLLTGRQLDLSSLEIAILKLPKLDAHLKSFGLALDHEQRLACARPERNLLIRARAGSGKTRTLAAIATIAIEDEKLNPDQVMILAFNKRAAEEIGERVRQTSGITKYRNARTFHSLAYQLADHQNRTLVFNDGNLEVSRQKQNQFIERTIHAVLNPAFREKLYEFFRKEIEQIERIGSNLKGNEYISFRRALTNYSLNGDNVKSNGEKFIADFLFEHDISYEYEKGWSWKKQDRLQGSAYRPDFSLLSHGKDLILEHWGIDPDDPRSEVPKWWKTSTAEYREQIEAKRRFWKQRNISLIETHTGMLHDGREAFELKLTCLLSEQGIECRKLDHIELVERVAKAPRTFSRMGTLFLGFISRAKKRGWSVADATKIIATRPDAELRNRIFHELAIRAYSEYENLLAQDHAWDFDDMLTSATTQVRTHGDIAEIGLGPQRSMQLRNLRWLLIDEFQDFSELYYRLVRAILDTNPEIRVVAVGDDWQAINGFAGAQLSFFEKFGSYFDGAGTANISKNYRSGRSIVGAGNKVMEGHGQQANTAPNTWSGHVETFDFRQAWVDESDEAGSLCLDSAKYEESGRIDYELAKALKSCTDFIADSIYEIEGRRWLPDVLLLARTGRAYGVTLNEFKSCLRYVLDRHPRLQDIANIKDFNLEAMTAHGAKGKEADTVIVLETTAKQFPKVHADNQLFGPFDVTAEDTLAEERRLFYVAITRAKHRLLLLTEENNESPFLEELKIAKGNTRLMAYAKGCRPPEIQLGETARLIMDRLKKNPT